MLRAAFGRHVEAGERLGPDGLSGREVADRLEDHPERALTVDRAPHATLARPAPILGAAADAQLPDELLDHVARDLDRQAALTFGRLLDRVDDGLDRAPLHEVPDDSRLEHLQDGLTIVCG